MSASLSALATEHPPRQLTWSAGETSAPRMLAPSSSEAFASTALAPLLAPFDPISLVSSEAVALLARTDTKYVLTQAQLGAVLPMLAGEYWVLEIDGRRLHCYRTLYFDTPEFSLFRSHGAGKAIRHKVRSRAYVDTGVSYLEVKAKDSKRRTVKYRLRTDALVSHLHPHAVSFVASHVPVPPSSLEPALWNGFHRITLVGKRHAERLTVDVGLTFSAGHRRVHAFPGLVIAELKQGRLDRTSPFVRQMRAASVQPAAMSKYCVGVSLLHGLDGRVRYNAFKPALRALEKLARGAALRS